MTRERKLPQFAGPSTTFAIDNPVPADLTGSDKPLKNCKLFSKVSRGRFSVMPREERRAAINTVEQIDEELYYFLLLEIAYRPRDHEVLPTLVSKAKRFLQEYDTSFLTYKQRYTMIINAVTAAMDVPKEEIHGRQHCKNPVEAKERLKHNEFVTEGITGSTFWGKCARISGKR